MTAPSVREALELAKNIIHGAKHAATHERNYAKSHEYQTYIDELDKALATAPAPTPSAARERIGRIIDPSAFENWQGQYDYCLKTNSDEPEARRCADYFHKAACDEAIAKADAILSLLPDAAAIRAAAFEEAARVPLKPDDVEWVVNDIAELGVKIGEQFFFLYKGRSLVYGTDELSSANGVALNEDTDPPTQHMWRPVFKREFGECAHPINYTDPTKIGTVSLDDSDDWKPLPAAIRDAGENAK